MGGRIPSVVTKEEWDVLTDFLVSEHKDKFVLLSVEDIALLVKVVNRVLKCTKSGQK